MSEFDNINGIYAKDATLRAGITALRDTVVGQTIKPLSVTENGTYTANPAEGTYGYSPVTVDVVEQPWEPLEDGYSNFWFELTDDTLSPWLNFSAKDNDAVIDWGDGSGEVALDTLTPTHTYSKAGKYVVKVKGVTGIARQHAEDAYTDYINCLQYVELNSEVTTVSSYGFFLCVYLKRCIMPNVSSLGSYAFTYCSELESLETSVTTLGTQAIRFNFHLKAVTLTALETLGQYNLQYCVNLETVTLPSTLATIATSALNSCFRLSEIHIQATVPPTLGGNTLQNLPSNFIIYVPVGTLSAYQTAWSTYADHIVEEGSRLSAAQLRKIQSESTEEMR